MLVLDAGNKISRKAVDDTVLLFFRHVVECLPLYEHDLWNHSDWNEYLLNDSTCINMYRIVDDIVLDLLRDCIFLGCRPKIKELLNDLLQEGHYRKSTRADSLT